MTHVITQQCFLFPLKKRIARRLAKKGRFSFFFFFFPPTGRVKEFTVLPPGLNEGRLLGSFNDFCTQNPQEILKTNSMPHPAAVSPTCSQTHLQWQKSLNLCKQCIPLFCYITMKTLPLTPNLHITLILQGHGEELSSLQQLFLYLKSVTRISHFFYYISIISPIC